MCVGQRITCGSWFSPSNIWVSVDQTFALKLDGKYCHSKPVILSLPDAATL